MSKLDEIRARLEAKPCGSCINDFDLTGDIPQECKECHAPPADNFHRGWIPNQYAADIALLLEENERLKRDAEIVERFHQTLYSRMINALRAVKDRALRGAASQKEANKLADKITEIADEALKNIP